MARTNLAQPIDGALSTRGRGEFGSAGVARSGNRGPVVVTDPHGGTGVSQPWSDGSWTPTSRHNGNGTATMVGHPPGVLPGLGSFLADVVAAVTGTPATGTAAPAPTGLLSSRNLMIAAALGIGLFLLKKK